VGYIGKVPADVLIDPMVDSAAITDATIVTADIANDAVTSAKLAANSVDSSELIDGSVDNSHLAGSIAINKTLLAGGTGLTLSTNTLNVDAAQTQITSVGTIGTGVWNGTKVASAYLDDDTAHLSTTQTFSGAKTFSADAVFGGDVSLSTADKRYYIPRASDAALTGSLYSRTGNIITLSGAGSSSGQIEFIPSAANSSAVALTLDSSQNATFAGNVTIGGNLTVNGTGSDIITGDYLYLDAHDNSAAKNLVFRKNDDTWLGQIEFHPTNKGWITTRVDQPLAFGTNNNEMLYIDTAGNVGIGSGSNTNARIVRGFSANKGLVIETAQPAIQLVDTDNTGRYFTMAYEQSAKTVYMHNQSNGPFRFDTNGTARMTLSGAGSLQIGTGAMGTTNADNWGLVSKSTTGGTIGANGGMAYFALGDNYTTADAILMVRNDGNRGSFRHASGSSLIKAQFNDGTAFEVTKDGMIKGMQGAPARIAGNWEVVDVLSAEDNQSSYLQSDNCFNDNIYSQFKIVIPYINCDTANATLLFTFMYNSGSGLTEQTGDYYGSMDISPHTASSYSGGVQSDATRAELFGAMHGHLAVGVSGEMNIYDAFIADLRQYNQFTANTMRSGDGNLDGDRGANYRPMIDARFLGYNTAYSAYVSQRSFIRCNTDRHASYWKGFRIQASSGNLGAKSQIIVLGRAL